MGGASNGAGCQGVPKVVETLEYVVHFFLERGGRVPIIRQFIFEVLKPFVGVHRLGGVGCRSLGRNGVLGRGGGCVDGL